MSQDHGDFFVQRTGLIETWLAMPVSYCEYWNFISPLSTDLPTLERLRNTLLHRRIGSLSMTLIEWTFLTQWPAVVLFSSATPDSKPGLLKCCSTVPLISSLFTMTELLDCYPAVHKYSLLTIQHECWRGGGTWL